MANFEGVTASSGAAIKPEKLEELMTYLEGFSACGEDGDMVKIEGNTIQIYGYDWFAVYEKYEVINSDTPEEKEVDYDNDVTDTFLEGLKPFLEEPLIVQSIGNEKCRYPLSAWEWKVNPEGEIQQGGFSLS